MLLAAIVFTSFQYKYSVFLIGFFPRPRGRGYAKLYSRRARAIANRVLSAYALKLLSLQNKRCGTGQPVPHPINENFPRFRKPLHRKSTLHSGGKAVERKVEIAPVLCGNVTHDFSPKRPRAYFLMRRLYYLVKRLSIENSKNLLIF
jgi:hypothetical protein